VLFWIVAIFLAVLSFMKKLSLLPVLGMVSCFYLMAQENHSNWLRFLAWLAIGLIIYFSYSFYNSKLHKEAKAIKNLDA